MSGISFYDTGWSDRLFDAAEYKYVPYDRWMDIKTSGDVYIKYDDMCLKFREKDDPMHFIYELVDTYTPISRDKKLTKNKDKIEAITREEVDSFLFGKDS